MSVSAAVAAQPWPFAAAAAVPGPAVAPRRLGGVLEIGAWEVRCVVAAEERFDAGELFAVV